LTDILTNAPKAEFNEKEALEFAREGDREAYGRIVLHHRERLYCAALGLVRNHEDARDLSQDAFVRAYKNLARFDTRRPFYPWLYRILRNLCLDHLERHGPARQVSLDALVEDSHAQFDTTDGHASASTGDVRQQLFEQQRADALRAALDRLKPEFREIIIMKHLEDLSYKDISQALDIPMGTVMSRLFHARKALAALLEEYRA
jgi:RNA polymerase sigma-70 factor (ECF subfamily)